jgi:hypothetical protein
MCYTLGGKYIGILNDYDLAAYRVGTDPKRATSKHRTGTAIYMSRMLLKDPPKNFIVRHLYVFELESFFYILLFLALGYKYDIPANAPLVAWYNPTLTWQALAQLKDDFWNNSCKDIFDKVCVSFCLFDSIHLAAKDKRNEKCSIGRPAG